MHPGKNRGSKLGTSWHACVLFALDGGYAMTSHLKYLPTWLSVMDCNEVIITEKKWGQQSLPRCTLTERKRRSLRTKLYHRGVQSSLYWPLPNHFCSKNIDSIAVGSFYRTNNQAHGTEVETFFLIKDDARFHKSRTWRRSLCWRKDLSPSLQFMQPSSEVRKSQLAHKEWSIWCEAIWLCQRLRDVCRHPSHLHPREAISTNSIKTYDFYQISVASLQRCILSKCWF